MQATGSGGSASPRLIAALGVLTLMATGRAMTLAFIARAGDGGPGDPPAAWLMPLVGDAVIGLAAPLVAYLLWRRPEPLSWLVAVVWGVVATFDAAAAYLVEVSAPWPEFFMLELFGRTMFVAAIVLHVVVLALLGRPGVRRHFRVPRLVGSSEAVVVPS